jgi:vitamin B12 transporter
MPNLKSVRLAAGLASAACALLPVSVWGADASGDIVVTATGVLQDRDTAGQAITVLDRGTIETRQTVSVAELLATTPGVTFSRSGGPGGLTAVRIRGAEDSHTLTLIDGVRINDPSSTGGSFDFGNLLSLVVDHVEILRGANSVPWGSQAIGGIVNIATALPTQELSARASAEYGYKDSANVVTHVSGKSGPVSASLGGGYFRDDGVSAYRFGTERDGYRQYALTGRVGIDLGSDAGLDFRAYYADSRRDTDGFMTTFPYSFIDTPGHATTKELVTYAGAHFGLLDGALNNRLAFTLTNVDRDLVDLADPFSNGQFRGAVQRIEYRGDARLSDSIRAVFGAEHEFSRAKDGFTRESTTADSGFAQLVLTPVRQLTVTGGIRVDDYRTYGTKATFAANAAWRPAEGLTLRANYSEGFKAPSLYQLFSFYGNSDLNPETSRNYEVGAEQRLIGGRAVLGLTLFRRDTTNLIDFLSCFGLTAGPCAGRPNGLFDGVYANIGRARASGVEATALVRPVDGLTMEANYTYADSENRLDGTRLLRRPRHSFNASVDWEAVKDVKLGATVRSVSSSEDIDYQTFSPTTLGGYTLVTLRASVAINAHLELYGRVENLFDEEYEMVSGYGTVGRAAFLGVRAKL